MKTVEKSPFGEAFMGFIHKLNVNLKPCVLGTCKKSW